MIGTPKAELPPGHVHLWSLFLDQHEQVIAELYPLLSVDERSRADRQRSTTDRRSFISCRGRLRLILGSYINAAPDQFQYRAGPFGKLELAAPAYARSIRFSVSRSGGRAMIAVAQNREVGIDLEQIRPIPDLSQIVADVCSTHEQTVIRSLQEGDRLAAFFSAWTQKEAYLKGRGVGLSQPPQEVVVGVPPVQRVGLLYDYKDPTAAGLWSLSAWRPALGYTAALAVQGHDARVVCRGEPCSSEAGSQSEPAKR